jgi:hypothetical protein
MAHKTKMQSLPQMNREFQQTAKQNLTHSLGATAERGTVGEERRQVVGDSVWKLIEYRPPARFRRLVGH